MKTVGVLLDTNTFLHYLSIDQIDWNEIFPSCEVTLIICPPVIRELNKHKDTPKSAKLRDRAAATLRRLEQLADSPESTALRGTARVSFIVHDSNIDFAEHNLVREVADDHLIASLITLREGGKYEEAILLSKDIGLKLKARTQGIPVTSLPETMLLPDDLLPSEKRLKEVEAELRELQNMRPKLELLFPEERKSINVVFQCSQIMSDTDISKRMVELKSKYPKMVAKSSKNAVSSGVVDLSTLLQGVGHLSRIEPESIEKYNESLNEYFEKYEEYLEDLSSYQEWESRTTKIQIVLANRGSSPAEDVDIFMHFPDGFELFGEDEYEEEPEAPTPPSKPQSLLELYQSRNSIGNLGYSSPYGAMDYLNSMIRGPVGPSNVSTPKIKKTNSYDVKVHVQKSKHGIDISLRDMYLTFDEGVPPQNFEITYVIHASNIPKQVNGVLHVIV